jgi:general secretion pathway protein K
VVVLGLLIVLGVLASEVARAVQLEARSVASLRARTVARYAAESGIALAEQRLRTLLDSVTSVSDRATLLNERDSWLAPLRQVSLGDARFGVTVTDLNARLDLNHTDVGTLSNLFARFTDEARASAIATAIREAPLARLGELSVIPGIDAALALAVAPYITVYGDGSINVNSAPEPVLASLPSVGEAGARALIDRRESGGRFTTSADLRLGGTRAPAGMGEEGCTPSRSGTAKSFPASHYSPRSTLAPEPRQPAADAAAGVAQDGDRSNAPCKEDVLEAPAAVEGGFPGLRAAAVPHQ